MSRVTNGLCTKARKTKVSNPLAFLLFARAQVDAVNDPEGAQAEAGIPGALTAAPGLEWEEDAQRILEILGLKGQR